MSVSLATYGDVAANSVTGKWLALALSPIALIALARIIEAYTDMRTERHDTSLAGRLEDLRDILDAPQADRDSDGSINRDEFVLYYCAKHQLVPTKEACAQADAQFDALDLFKNGKLDGEDLRILQRALALEQQLANAQAALRHDPSAVLTKERFIAGYTAKGGASAAEAAQRFAELDRNQSGTLEKADLEALLREQNSLVNPQLEYTAAFTKAKGDVAKTHPLVRVITQEATREAVTCREARDALMLLLAYMGISYALFHHWRLDTPLLSLQGPGDVMDAPTAVAMATSLLATLPTMIGGLPPLSQTLRALAIPLTIFAFFAVGQKTVVTCIRWVEQQTWDTLKRQHKRFLFETAKAAATAEHFKDVKSGMANRPSIAQVEQQWNLSEKMREKEHATDLESMEAVFGLRPGGARADDGQALAQMAHDKYGASFSSKN